MASTIILGMYLLVVVYLCVKLSTKVTKVSKSIE